ncbi:MAG: RpiB/LacA/LacB family sugar-phosphate isomerase [Candidatus Magasanikbacteria bacterium]|nr:RpiB/LacA/LacB family sugar-phosphate isomerase [Candidatus Magasanikbacteria bacterium]
MLYIASDHAGFQLKKELIKYIQSELNQEITDLGPEILIETDDFPDYAVPLAKTVAQNKESFGILICGSGHGTCIAANKIKGAYAILGYNIRATELGRKDNNANILCLGARLLPSADFAKAIVKKFLDTKFDGDERFKRRNKKIEELEI